MIFPQGRSRPVSLRRQIRLTAYRLGNALSKSRGKKGSFDDLSTMSFEPVKRIKLAADEVYFDARRAMGVV